MKREMSSVEAILDSYLNCYKCAVSLPSLLTILSLRSQTFIQAIGSHSLPLITYQSLSIQRLCTNTNHTTQNVLQNRQSPSSTTKISNQAFIRFTHPKTSSSRITLKSWRKSVTNRSTQSTKPHPEWSSKSTKTHQTHKIIPQWQQPQWETLSSMYIKSYCMHAPLCGAFLHQY